MYVSMFQAQIIFDLFYRWLDVFEHDHIRQIIYREPIYVKIYNRYMEQVSMS